MTLIENDADNCFMCKQKVRSGQQALSCDVCDGWVHRTCDGRMDQATYRDLNRRMTRGDLMSIDWKCIRCDEQLPPQPPSPIPVSKLENIGLFKIYYYKMLPYYRAPRRHKILKCHLIRP